MTKLNTEILHEYMKLNNESTLNAVMAIATANGVNTQDPILEMNKRFAVWSTEILTYEENDKKVECVVALYLPGMVKTGRAEAKLNQYTKAKKLEGLYKEAIYDAISQLGIYYDRPEEETDDKKKETPKVEDKQPAPIAPAVVTPNVQPMSGYPDIDELPLDSYMVNNPQLNAGQAMAPQPQVAPQVPNNAAPPAHPQQNPKAKSNFRQDQIDFVKALKATNKITTDEQLVRTFACWDPSIVNVQMIYGMTEQRMDQFVLWMKNAGPLAL